MAKLKGTKTHENLKDAFAGESQANRRYLYFAKVADVEGYPEIAGNFRDTAEGETGHAHGHLDYLKRVGDPATDLPIGDTAKNLKAAVAGETHEYTDMYPGMAKTARDEGFAEIADWFETLAKAEKSHAGRFQSAARQDQLIAPRTIDVPRRRRSAAAARLGGPSDREPHRMSDDRSPTPRPTACPTIRPSRPTGTTAGARARRSRGSSRSATAVACASSTATPSRACSS